MKFAVQIDFDETVTIGDVSYLLLDTFAGKEWRKSLEEYSSGKINVGTFNSSVFGMLKTDIKTMTDFVLTYNIQIRPGFTEFLDYCRRKGARTVIVSNGWLFYIQAILKKVGIKNIKELEIHAAENIPDRDSMKVAYIGPDGKEMMDGFKEAYTRYLIEKGYSVIYVGDGNSDIYSARIAKRVFATGQLLQRCRDEKIGCVPFKDFYEVIDGIKNLKYLA
jgi:2-hydroxy-3-keto-5-methylthiopentenyl-1-phosphate phosphatase